MNRIDHLQALQALLPQGAAWPRDPKSNMTSLLNGFAGRFESVDHRLGDLLNEADPTTTLEMLEDWERVTGLPDPCLGPSPSLDKRRDRLLSRLFPPRTSNPKDMVAFAERIGFPGCQVTEPSPFRTNSSCVDAVYGTDWDFVWIMHCPDPTGTEYFLADSACDDALVSWGELVLECAIREISPIHTIVLFTYGGIT